MDELPQICKPWNKQEVVERIIAPYLNLETLPTGDLLVTATLSKTQMEHLGLSTKAFTDFSIDDHKEN